MARLVTTDFAGGYHISRAVVGLAIVSFQLFLRVSGNQPTTLGGGGQRD